MMKRIFSLLLSLLLIAGLLSGCKKNPEGEEGSDSLPADTSAAEERTVTLKLSDYTLVRPMGTTAEMVSHAADFKKALDARTGGEMALSDDFLRNGESPDSEKKELLIGLTNRPESEAALAALNGRFTWSITLSGNKLVLAAPTAELMGLAMDHFLNAYVAEGSDLVTLPETLSLIHEDYDYCELISAGVPKYQVVYGKSASRAVFQAASGLVAALSKHADEAATLSTDWEEEAEVLSFVLGDTVYTHSKALAAECPSFGWISEASGKQIYLYGHDSLSIATMCNDMAARIAEGVMLTEEGSGTVRICRPGRQSGIAADWCGAIPTFEGATVSSITEYATGAYRMDVTGGSAETLAAYEAKLASAGYTLYDAQEAGGNRFATYVSDKVNLHAYYLSATGITRVLVSPAAAETPYPLTPVSDGALTTPKLTVMDMEYETQTNHDNGLGLVYTLADGSYIVIDGGYASEADNLYAYLTENNVRPDGKLLIRAWILTHPDKDHYDCLNEFARQYAKDVTVEYFVAQFDRECRLKDSDLDAVEKTIEASVARFAGVRTIVPKLGQRMYFGDAEVSFLYTAEALYPEVSSENNNHSLVFRVTLAGQSLLCTGDVLNLAINSIVRTWGSLLRSDIVTVPHHGYSGGTKPFWDAVDPSYIILPTAKDKAEERILTDVAYLHYLLTEKSVREYLVADTSLEAGVIGYTEWLLPFMGTGYVEREYEIDCDYGTQQDHVLWRDLFDL